nr:MAG: hypothetical protein DiTV3a_F13ORF1 [Diabrotica toursvirus 3a]
MEFKKFIDKEILSYIELISKQFSIQPEHLIIIYKWGNCPSDIIIQTEKEKNTFDIYDKETNMKICTVDKRTYKIIGLPW